MDSSARLAERSHALLYGAYRPFLPYVWHNPLFEADWYRERYPDGPVPRGWRQSATTAATAWPRVATQGRTSTQAGISRTTPRRFRPHGPTRPLPPLRSLGRSRPGPAVPDPLVPSPLNPEVREAGIDPLLHYVRHGAHEGRLPRPPRRAGASAAAPTGVQRRRGTGGGGVRQSAVRRERVMAGCPGGAPFCSSSTIGSRAPTAMPDRCSCSSTCTSSKTSATTCTTWPLRTIVVARPTAARSLRAGPRRLMRAPIPQSSPGCLSPTLGDSLPFSCPGSPPLPSTWTPSCDTAIGPRSSI